MTCLFFTIRACFYAGIHVIYTFFHLYKTKSDTIAICNGVTPTFKTLISYAIGNTKKEP